MSGSALRYALRALPLEDVPATVEADWLALAGHALEGNCFITPWFVKAAARWLDPGLSIQVLLVEAFRSDQRLGLTGVMAVRRMPASRSLPFAHLAAYRPLHAYSSGALIDAAHAEGTLQCLLADMPRVAPDSGALRLTDFRCDGALGALVERLLPAAGLGWFVTRSGSRAALQLAGEPDAITGSPSATGPAGDDHRDLDGERARSSLPRALERLEAMAGPVRFSVLRGRQVDDATIDRHLALEHAGWKGQAGSSMLANAAHAAFFREAVRGAAAAGSAVFCELSAGEVVVASTSNFVAGCEGFAFKLGWEPRLARYSPGLLVDEQLRLHAATALTGLRTMDGCAGPGSHLERIWPGRIRMADGYLAWGRRERSTLTAIATARKLRDAARGRLRPG